MEGGERSGEEDRAEGVGEDVLRVGRGDKSIGARVVSINMGSAGQERGTERVKIEP